MTVRKYLVTVDDVTQVVCSQRAALGLTREQVADRAGVSRRLVAEVEAGCWGTQVAAVLRVLTALEVHALTLPPATTVMSGADVDLDAHLDSYLRGNNE